MEPGDYGVVTTTGWAARLIQAVTRSRYNHAFIYVGNGQVIEGRPAGAGYANLSAYPDVLWSTVPLNPLEREHIVAAAVKVIGTPYSWVDCVAIGIADLVGWRAPQSVHDRLNRRDRLMCSQLVDSCYLAAGVHLFTDGRVPGDVAPSDLAELA
jgi:uncharacterized protein YycO